MRFGVRVIKPIIQIVKPFIDVGGEFFKPFVDVGGVVIESFVDVGGVVIESFVDVGGEVVEAFVYGFKPDVHCALQPINF
jgi:hypothetical protein